MKTRHIETAHCVSRAPIVTGELQIGLEIRGKHSHQIALVTQRTTLDMVGECRHLMFVYRIYTPLVNRFHYSVNPNLFSKNKIIFQLYNYGY